MTRARTRYIPELQHVHADDLTFLWGQRRVSLASRKHTLREYGEINERIEAHVQGLAIAPLSALHERMQSLLASEERDEVCTGAFALLRLDGQAALRLILGAFSQATGHTLAGFRDALSLASHDALSAEMGIALERGSPMIAASAAVVLANHRLLESKFTRLPELLRDPDPEVCSLAWRAVSMADLGGVSAPDYERPYARALEHGAPVVRHAGWAAAAWSSQTWTLPTLRQFAAVDDPVALHWLAVLGDESDATLLQQGALRRKDARTRCELLARFGHPSALNALVRWMGEGDVVLGVDARIAFERITGCEVRGERAQVPLPDTAEEFDREIAPLVWMPDAEKARRLVMEHEARWFEHPRWCQGTPLPHCVESGALAAMDMESRWDAAARAALGRHPVSAPCPIH